MIALSLDLAQSRFASDAIAATDKQFNAALQKSLRATGKTTVKRVVKTVSAATKVPQKRLKVRVKMRRYKDDNTVILWIGADPVPLDTVLGRVNMTTRSAFAGKIVRRGAFAAHIGRRGWRVFVREASDYYDPDLYSDTAIGVGFKKSSWGSLKSRFPVRLGVVRIEDEAKLALDDAAVDMQQEFEELFAKAIETEVFAKA